MEHNDENKDFWYKTDKILSLEINNCDHGNHFYVVKINEHTNDIDIKCSKCPYTVHLRNNECAISFEVGDKTYKAEKENGKYKLKEVSNER